MPEGFETDLDSIPRLGFIHAALKGRTVGAAVLHDYLLSIGISTGDADRVFARILVAEGVPARYRIPILIGVRLWHLWPFGRQMSKKSA